MIFKAESSEQMNENEMSPSQKSKTGKLAAPLVHGIQNF